MKKLFLLFLSTIMVASCSSPTSSSLFSSSESKEDFSSISSKEEETSEEPTSSSLDSSEEKEDEAFSYEDGIYTSKEVMAEYAFDTTLNYGTFVFSLLRKDTFSENGVLFHADKKENASSYYFIGVDIVGKFVVNKVKEGKSTTLYKEKLDKDYVNNFINFAFYIANNGEIDIYNDEALLTSIRDEELLDGEYVILKANGEGTSYKDVDFYQDENLYIDEFDYYHGAFGTFTGSDGKFMSCMNNSILVNDAVEFSNGTIEVEMKLNGDNKDNGIIFGLSSSSPIFWEGTGTQYYFFFTSLAGLAYLGKADNGGWIVCGNKDIPNFNNKGTYRLKISRSNETICCFIDDVLYIVYNDASPYQGTGFGLRSGAKDVLYSSLKVSHLTSEDGDIESYILGSGDVRAFEGVVKTTSSKTIGLKKDAHMYNGTLVTSFVPGGAQEAGLVFRATPIDDGFYEEEDGLSYYFLYIENGVVSFTRYDSGEIKKETRRYFPYGIATSYEAKIIMNDNDIYCYLNGRLVMHYQDDNPLKGDMYGFKSKGKDLIVTGFKEKDVEEKQTNKYLIFGHSYTDFWKTYKEDFDELDDIYNIGIGGAITSDWGKDGFEKEVIAYEPEYGIYWNGINDINRNFSNATIGNNVRNMAREIHEALPNFKLILIGVCRCPIDSHRRNDIKEVNNYYKAIASDYDYVYYVDTELLYCDAYGNEVSSYFTDGLHPSHQAYLMCVEKIMDILGGEE